MAEESVNFLLAICFKDKIAKSQNPPCVFIPNGYHNLYSEYKIMSMINKIFKIYKNKKIIFILIISVQRVQRSNMLEG